MAKSACLSQFLDKAFPVVKDFESFTKDRVLLNPSEGVVNTQPPGGGNHRTQLFTEFLSQEGLHKSRGPENLGFVGSDGEMELALQDMGNRCRCNCQVGHQLGCGVSGN